ncbi:hypothetical protein [Pseudomonas fluorescens]|uniref:hypothetical protein n=1 Tax=Pseudomonas fluorescens TaxID=294 RepID=UPI0005FB46F4|nr:hypothetical protein [Pseudomonas fluorescens]KJZ40766.1 hypothetical protein VC33_02460 [Pseudomonas fluorescens]
MSDTTFKIVTDPVKIRQLNTKLAKIISARFPYKQSRELTYPAGHHTGRVYFEEEHGTRVRGWSPKVSDAKKHVNHLLFGDPGNDSWLELAVQLNFPKEKYSRAPAGAFVQDAFGEIFVAHRGKLTKGNAGLPKDLVLSQFKTCVLAQDGKKKNPVILIAGLEHEEMVDKLFEFALEAREVATRIANGLVDIANTSANSAAGGDRQKGKKTKAEPMAKLSKYVDEFYGESTINPPVVSGTRIVTHGAIVSALHKALGGGDNLRKSQAVDLAAIRGGTVDLFEVKTSASTQDIYTAVGQLLIHGEGISALLDMPVRRFMVLPQNPRDDFLKPIGEELGAKIIIYCEQADSYVFDGL